MVEFSLITVPGIPIASRAETLPRLRPAPESAIHSTMKEFDDPAGRPKCECRTGTTHANTFAASLNGAAHMRTAEDRIEVNEEDADGREASATAALTDLADGAEALPLGSAAAALAFGIELSSWENGHESPLVHVPWG